MTIIHKQFTSVGIKMHSGQKRWAIVDEGRIREIEYMPMFEKMFPSGTKIPCIVSTERNGVVTYKADLGKIYRSFYKEGETYRLHAVELKTDLKTYLNSILVEDDYGLQITLPHPTAEDISCVGGDIECVVDKITERGIIIKSTSEGKVMDSSERVLQDYLFDKLHDEHTEDFKVLNKQSYRGIWQSIVDKYPDSVHFIYELLQNADDALASTVTIILDKSYIAIKHNGSVHFTVTDSADRKSPLGHINSIASIGDSTKSQEELTQNKIGKFGIGFKSVFQYTDAPEIYDDYFKFRIVNYIIPERIGHDHPLRNPGETLFVIPFKTSIAPYEEIALKLKKLANVTLFLHNLRVIRWSNLVSGETRQFSKDITMSISRKHHILFEKLELRDYDESLTILMFSRTLKIGDAGNHRIYVGYYLDKEGNIDTNVRPPVYCFFPTSETFNRCMIIHAPFLLVDNRQQIKPNELVNEALVKEIGRLVADSLIELRNLGKAEGCFLLNSNISDIIGWHERNRLDYRLLARESGLINSRAIVEPCVEKLKEASLFLTKDNTYVKPSEAYRIKPDTLYELLSSSQLRHLRKSEQVAILDENLNDVDFSGIKEAVQLNYYDTTAFAKDITAEFMEAQKSPWIGRLFSFLINEARNSWNPKADYPYFLYAPIIKTDKGTWVTPYLDGELNVYLSSDGDGAYNVVSSNMLSNKGVAKFLEEIGCRKPDQKDFIIKRILSKYSKEQESYDEDLLLEDFRLLYGYYVNASYEDRKEFLRKAKNTLWVAVNNCLGEDYVLKISCAYLDTNDLKTYFAGNNDIFFFDSAFYKSVIASEGRDAINGFLIELGIISNLSITSNPSYSTDFLTRRQKEQIGLPIIKESWHSVMDYQITGLWRCLMAIDRQKSHAMWNLVSKLNFDEYAKGTYKYQYYSVYEKKFDSSPLEQLRYNAWIFVKKQKLTPDKVSLELFSEEGYDINNRQLLEALGIKSAKADLKRLGASDDQIRQCELGALAEKLGVTRAEIERLAEEKKRKESKKQKTNQETQKNDNEGDPLKTSRKELERCGSEVFDKVPVYTELPGKSRMDDLSQRSEKRREELQERHDKALADLQKKEELEDKRDTVLSTPKYTKAWFENLLQLEYRNETPRQADGNSKAISISFSKVIKDPNSDRIYILKDPSSQIPLSLEEIEKLEVRFQFCDKEEKSITFEVASVRDFTLRIKAKAKDIKALNKIDWSRCTRALVSANNPTELMGKLISAFNDLGYDDNFDFKANLQDNVSFVFGPPGTGKTTYVSQEICDLMSGREHCRILVLAPTNKACDVITERIAQIAGTPSWLGRFVATGSAKIESVGLLVNRDSHLYDEDRCCVVSTISRLPYDGFQDVGSRMNLRDVDWDFVFIDEASMVPIAQIVYAIYRFSPYAKIIVAGDPLQIPPIVMEDLWQDENIYKMVNLDRFDNPVTEPIQFEIVNLETQYRSVPAIGNVFSHYAYAGKLKNFRDQDSQSPLLIRKLPLKTINLIEFRVEKYDNIFGAKKLSGSNIQIYSVLLVTELCKYIANNYQEEKTLNIGIICPYRAEAQLIQHLIEQMGDIPENVTVNVGTIHGFQGDECDAVFVVFNPPTALGSSRTSSESIMLNKRHIVNVAVSRAKDYLFLLIPHPNTPGFSTLTEIRRLGNLIYSISPDDAQMLTADQVEEIIFGKQFYLETNSFVTSHQMANVYTEAQMKYEIRIDENAVDVQLSD